MRRWLRDRLRGLSIYVGSGSPEGVVAAPVVSVFVRVDRRRGPRLYMKEAGTGPTGWLRGIRLAAGSD